MSTRLTLFTATLVQDSALSVSGVDRESSSDQPFAMIDGTPVLAGRGLKGAVVAMARRFFDPLPRSVSEDANRRTALRRSSWEFSNSTPEGAQYVTPRLRAGVGILQKTSARASGVLYDREVVPAETRWHLVVRVDWSWAGGEAEEAEGILGYVLAHHWAHGRCWLGGGAARGLGWCHLEGLRAHRLDEEEYEKWVESGRKKVPAPLAEVPAVQPTRSWCFRTLDVRIGFGENDSGEPGEAPWGLDMLAVGPHDSDRAEQRVGAGTWAAPSWVAAAAAAPDAVPTDRALLMELDRPLLPGASVRGPMRHTFSRSARMGGESVQDPHPVQGKVSEADAAGEVFGTVARSSRILIRDGRAADGWAAARLHMHAEDEFSAGSYESAKRDAVRLLRGEFSVRIVVEGPDDQTVAPLVGHADRIVTLGALGHLPLGGHKTRGAGWGRWAANEWLKDDVVKVRDWEPHPARAGTDTAEASRPSHQTRSAWATWREASQDKRWVSVKDGSLTTAELTLGTAATEARSLAKASGGEFVAWWCEPSIDFTVTTAPATFGREWPEHSALRIDEAVFFAERASWRVARTATGVRWVLVEEVEPGTEGAEPVEVVKTPARLHADSTRFSAAELSEKGRIVVREWRLGDVVIGFTLVKEGG